MISDLTEKTGPELDNIITNYRRANRVTDSVFLEALRLREKMSSKGLDFEKSRSIIIAAAQERRFISYKEVSDASGCEWAKVHYSVGRHLFRLLEYSRGKGWPPLSAIVVNADKVLSGEMKTESLDGFIAGAAATGYNTDGDPTALLQAFQQEVFAWAKEHKES